MIDIPATARPWLRALNGVVLSFPVALFAMALATDIAYLRTAEIQWTNFSAWLITGALVFGAVALVFAILALVAGLWSTDRRRRLVYAGALALMCLLGLVNAFKHSQDAWSSVGAFGLILSILCALLALVAGVIAWSAPDAPARHSTEVAR
jgi:uncharacterized membrane protein